MKVSFFLLLMLFCSMDKPQFINFPVEGPDDCFLLLVIVHKNATNIHCINFPLSWVSTQGHSCWIIWLEYVWFCKKLLNSLPKYCIILPLGMNESSGCSTSLPVSIARFKKESQFHWCILATHCSIHNFLMTDDINHIFIGSLATYISSLVSCV